MGFKGTKGNWRMCISDDGDLVSDVKHLYPTKLVCQIYKHKSIEGRANSLLISKAPEMLEMLKVVLYDYRNYQQNILVDEYRNRRISLLEELIKSATEI